jgi:uncharacterized membrane protein YraQ (UPF0718 family)
MQLLSGLLHALLIAAGMAWQVAWSLILGFILSGVVQAVVSKDRMRATLGRNGVREIALATLYGAASSSCSYAATAMSKTLFKKGAGLIPSLAFLFSSTNLVIELGIIIYVLMGWQFTAGEWIGGVLLVAIMSIAVKVTYPRKLVEEARAHVIAVDGDDDDDEEAAGESFWQKLRDPQTVVTVAQKASMDWSMLRTDLVIGFLIAGALAAFVPDHIWSSLFFQNASPTAQIVGGALIGPLVAIFTFVCSIGNVPMAAVLWAGGAGFGGVLAFLYADLIVLPLLDVYRKYYGWKMALYIGGIFYITMAAAAIVMDLGFRALHVVPAHPAVSPVLQPVFSFNYTFWLNLVFGALALWLWDVNRRNPMEHECCHHDAA